ncbi:MAG: hypothetical protein U0871_04930 [Gemmataceae bacterium]
MAMTLTTKGITQAAEVLNLIPITPWVLGTVERMLPTGRDDAVTWNRCWYEQYVALDGEVANSGTKPCPRVAARGLWYLGRLRRGQRPLLAWTVDEVYRKLSKNAAYAIIAADLLAAGPVCPAPALWPLVQSEFTRLTGDAPANSEQGEVRLVVALHRSGELVAAPRSR